MSSNATSSPWSVIHVYGEKKYPKLVRDYLAAGWTYEEGTMGGGLSALTRHHPSHNITEYLTGSRLDGGFTGKETTVDYGAWVDDAEVCALPDIPARHALQTIAFLPFLSR